VVDGGTRRDDGASDGGTRRDTGAGNGRTRREAGRLPAGGGEPDTRRDDVASGSSYTPGLPPILAARYSVVEELPASGTEADVFVVRQLESDGRFVLKLYRKGIQPDTDAVDRLADADPRHVVEVVGQGWDGGRWFEVMEYCAQGSLRALLRRGPVPRPADVLRELSSALTHVHALGLVHRDLKPENVLVRRLFPLDLVLGDFGLVRAMEGSVRWTRAWGTPAYSPPEFAGGEVSTAWDWWSLGMIVAELAGGRHPFESADGVMPSDQQIQAWLAQRAVDLSAVEDTRLALLCQGLLTRDRTKRWGTEQVQEWLAGGTPPVVVDRDPVPPGKRMRRVLFAEQELSTPAELAAALQGNWAEARRRLYQERDPGLAEEIERLLRQHNLTEAVRLLARPESPQDMPRRLADLLAELNPELEPVFDGVRLTSASLEEAAAEIVNGIGRHGATRTLDEIHRGRILLLWRGLPGMAHGPSTHEKWSAQLDALGRTFQSLRGQRFTPTPEQVAVAHAWLLLCVINPQPWTGRLAAEVEARATTKADRQPWWRALRSAGPQSLAELAAAYVSHAVAEEQSDGQDQEARRRRENERQQQREEEARRRAAADLAARTHQRRVPIWPGMGAVGGMVFGWWLACIVAAGIWWVIAMIAGFDMNSSGSVAIITVVYVALAIAALFITFTEVRTVVDPVPGERDDGRRYR
jgi:serine/threonine protein kinase